MANDTRWRRRDLFRIAAQAAGAASLGQSRIALSNEGSDSASFPPPSQPESVSAANTYEGQRLNRVAFPLGGMGAGMICLEGTGALTKFSLRHAPDLASEPLVFAALSIKGAKIAKVLEGPVPDWKKYAVVSDEFHARIQALWGLPRFRKAAFHSSFPFGTVKLADEGVPLDISITGWSPFEPGQEDDASLPVAALEYEFTNRTGSSIDAVLSFNAANVMKGDFGKGRIRSTPGGFVLEGELPGKPWTAGALAIATDDPAVKINHAWFRGWGMRWMVWKDVERGSCYDRAPISETDARSAPGASLFVPFSLSPGQSKRVVVRLAWYVGQSNLLLSGGGLPDFAGLKRSSTQAQPPEQCYRPWYAAHFTNVDEVMTLWHDRYSDLRERSWRFSQTFQSSTLPAEVLEAVSANLTIFKSPTVLRQSDGRFWAWEGSAEAQGSCDGSCTHVWNYAQALAHLFPRLERTLRETEFGPNQNAEGHQAIRTALPIRPTTHNFHAAADGQLGGIMKVYRDWRISGDNAWLARLWPKIRASLDYCIRTWDPRRRGWLEEPHHNTYDIEFWGPDGMCSSIYLGALKAATLMGNALHEDTRDYAALLRNGVRRVESELFNGEFFQQKIVWKGLNASYPEDAKKGIFGPQFPEELELADREGPQNQYGSGCLSDGVIGAWMAWACGIDGPLDAEKVTSHLRAVHRYNFKQDLRDFANPPIFALQSTYASGGEGGVVLCTWPLGDQLSIPFPIASCVWTGIEYQVASHLVASGQVSEGLDIIRACRRRYDGCIRNPFDEVEFGHWYGRALSSYALLQAFSGARYDAVDKTVFLRPTIKGDFRCFLSTDTGYGVVGVENGEPFVEVVSGEIPFNKVHYTKAKD